MDQILLIDKPAGMTSFGVAARIRRILTEQVRAEYLKKGQTPPKRVKVGHTGTLDPFATGLLIIMTGKNTKKCRDFLNLDKTYEATIYLGATSTTGDIEGEITKNPTATPPSTEQINTVINDFQGEITQKLPKFSAIKVNGERAYKLARRGADFEMPERKITVYKIEILNYNFPELTIRAHVSSGTYIRTLGEDIGKKLGTGGYLTALRRTKIGTYNIKDARTLQSLGITD